MEKRITVIPANMKRAKGGRIEPAEEKKIRVAAYCRVSTDQEEQLNSFENQVEYYTEYINKQPGYVLAGIYADEGISGTNTKKRAEFKRMIHDCESKKIDLVITKSISRFARNTQDCLMYSRKLKNLGIGIIFEKENINTLDATGELLFTILSSLAQDESRNISENCKWGIRSKFQKGIPHINTFKFMGFDKNEEGRLVINEKEAELVRRIYREFMEGFNPAQIAGRLNEEGIPGVSGKPKWIKVTIEGMLKNEKYKGDALLQKTYTADYLTKKQVKNTGQIEQYYVEDSHPAIIDKDTWEAVQLELERREEYKKEHSMANYGYGKDMRPFNSKVICSHCGTNYCIKSWKSRRVAYWECNKRFKEKGVIGCRGENVQDDILKRAFVSGWNQVVRERNRYLPRWKKPGDNPLQDIRNKQMIELTEQGAIKDPIPELVQMVLEQVIVRDPRSFLICFLDGTKVDVTI